MIRVHSSWKTAVGILILAMAGCQQPKDTDPGQNQAYIGRGPRQKESSVWEPRPVHIRVYPASRFTSAGGSVVLEARVEMTDEMGDPAKAAGRFRLELIRPQPGLTKADEKLYGWDVALLSLEHQKQYYDAVTRTYLFRLKMDDQLLPRQDTLLKVTFMPVSGEALVASLEMKAER